LANHVTLSISVDNLYSSVKRERKDFGREYGRQKRDSHGNESGASDKNEPLSGMPTPTPVARVNASASKARKSKARARSTTALKTPVDNPIITPITLVPVSLAQLRDSIDQRRMVINTG